MFAAAIDRFQPCLLNCSTEGAAWKRHGVTKDRVIARNAPIAEGSAALWEATSRLIDNVENAGHIRPGP
jgi:putative hydrolase of HD superfamily